MREPRSLRVLATLLLLTLAACPGGDGPDQAVVGDPTPGGTAVIGVLGDFQAFNPVTNTHLTSDEVGKFMLFTPLIQYDGDLNPVPYLAESWDLTENSVTFRLRDDVRWHDGQPVTAEDVKFTFDLAKNPETASLLGSAYLGMVRSATVIDPRTIRFDFVAPHAQPLDGFWWAPLPQHLLGNVSPAMLAQHQFNRNPLGSGPFRFVSWDANQQLVLEANPEFTPGLGGRPHLDRVVFRIIPDATALMTELQTGAADLIGYTLLPDQAVQLQGQRGVEVRHFPAREFNYLAWNNTRPLFQDARVRRALAMAIDRQRIIEGLVHGFGEPASGMIPPWSPLDPGIQPLPYDPEGARRQLAEAGWTPGPDGILRNPQGQPFRFILMTNSENRLRQDMATVIQQQLRQVGIDAQVRTSEFQTMLQQFRARNYDAIISAWILDTFKVDPTPLFSCEEARREGTANRTGYCNPQADALMQQGLRTTDQGEASRIWTEFSRLLQQDQPMTFLFWIEDLAGLGPRLQNVEMDPRGKIANIREWWIPENRRRGGM